MEWSSLLAELPKAVPTLIGVLLGGLLTLAGQYFTHRFTRTREREKFLREKAEELLQTLFTHMDWVDAQSGAMLHQVVHDDPSLLNRAHILQMLYFPQLAREFHAIDVALKPFMTLVSSLSAKPRELLVDQQAWLAQFDATELRTLHRAYLKAVHEAIWAILAATPLRSLRPFPRPTISLRPPQLPDLG